MQDQILLSCPDIGVPLLYKGKVREVFDLGERLLIVATDRLSAFDVVFPDGIPGKGRVLTQLSILWFNATRHLVPNHLISGDVQGLGLPPDIEQLLADRSMVVRKTKRIDVECVVRGYLAGSGWKEYLTTSMVTGIPLPAGLKLSSRLPQPIFTPALKNDVGHDENVPESVVARRFGAQLAAFLRHASVKLYAFAAEKALQAGIILADTKLEFGWLGEEVILIDELFTPDSSRFWPLDAYQEGVAIDSLDKQPIRDYVESIGWNKQPPAPRLPAEVIRKTSERYEQALARLREVLESGR
jgi:phosphoribosylaminoimidazole-succinocarboxamide synthase